MSEESNLLNDYYAKRQEVENLKRALFNAEAQLERLRRLILPEVPTHETQMEIK